MRIALEEEVETRDPSGQIINCDRDGSKDPVGDAQIASDSREFLGIDDSDVVTVADAANHPISWAKQATQELSLWEAITIDLSQVAAEQDVPLPVNKINNALYLSEVIDVNKWWSVQILKGSPKFSLLSRVAARYLNKPPANGLQERVFGTAKFIDTPLRRKLGSERFEMLSLLKFNANFIRQQEYKRTPDSDQAAIVKVAQFFMSVLMILNPTMSFWMKKRRLV